MAEQAGKVYLVGSGPGDAAYLTVQAQEILAQAEVLVYDALVDGALVNLVPDACLKLDVGKRGGQPSTPQSEINQILVEYCLQGKVVIRLKNGDPFVFGRAQSEIGALKRANCEFEVVPGLSSALVAPLLAGIPLTDPQLSQNFTVITGHNPDGLNWVALSKLDTLVFLMAGQTLPEIVRRLRGHGRSPYTPIAVIRYAGRDQQQIWDGSLNDILEKTAGESLSPCVVVVGEVVKLRAYIVAPNRQRRPQMPNERPDPDTNDRFTEGPAGNRLEPKPRRRRNPQEFDYGTAQIPPDRVSVPGVSDLGSVPPPPPRHPDPFPPRPDAPEPEPISTEPLPLSGKTVLVTRAASQSSQFTTLLEDQGASVIEMPTLEIVPPSSWRDLDRAISHLDDFDWLILTSTNGVDYFFQRLEAVTGERTFSTNIKIAVVGEKTAQRLERMGILPDFIPPNFVADSLVSTFPEPLGGLRVLFPRVESGGREVLVKEFTSQGAKVREVAAYESRCPDTTAPAALKALQSQRVDIITFASSKTVQHFCQLLENVDRNWPTWLEGICIASIGPQTTKSCQTLLGRVDVEATEYTLEGLTHALIDWATTPEVEVDPVLIEGTHDSEKLSHSDSQTASPTNESFAENSLPGMNVASSSETLADAVLENQTIETQPDNQLDSPEREAIELEVIEVNDFMVLESPELNSTDAATITPELLEDNSADRQTLIGEAQSLPSPLSSKGELTNPALDTFNSNGSAEEDAQLIADLQAVLVQEEHTDEVEIDASDPWEDNV